MWRELGELLGVEELRERFLVYTRAAYELVEKTKPRRVLDMGCGSGQLTLELARLCGGHIQGIDVDSEALAILQQRITRAGLEGRVSARRGSVLRMGFADGSFDLLWAEGVLHMVRRGEALDECARVLAKSGHLVVVETLDWLQELDRDCRRHGFEVVGRVPWKSGCWWTDFYAPLAERLGQLRELPSESQATELSAEIAMVRRNPAAFDCSHLVLRRE
jgi:ubiquinone/menaquinone biosynthesis C-methylase UbiE